MMASDVEAVQRSDQKSWEVVNKSLIYYVQVDPNDENSSNNFLNSVNDFLVFSNLG